MLGPIQRRSGKRFKSGAKERAAKSANNINQTGWETLAQRKLITQICAFTRHTRTPGEGPGKRQGIDF